MLSVCFCLFERMLMQVGTYPGDSGTSYTTLFMNLYPDLTLLFNEYYIYKEDDFDVYTLFAEKDSGFLYGKMIRAALFPKQTIKSLLMKAL